MILGKLAIKNLKIWHIVLELTPRFSSPWTHSTLSFIVNFVAQKHKWEVFWITRAKTFSINKRWNIFVLPCLNQKFVTPCLQRFERVGICDVVGQNTAISSSIESNTQRLEAFLTCRVPNLNGYHLVVNCDVLCEEISTNGGFILCGETVVDILVHERCLANTYIINFGQINP